MNYVDVDSNVPVHKCPTYDDIIQTIQHMDNNDVSENPNHFPFA